MQFIDKIIRQATRYGVWNGAGTSNGPNTPKRRWSADELRRDGMAENGLEIDANWGAFRAPGAADRDLQWYDWQDSGRTFDRKLALKTPVRHVLPPMQAKTASG